MIVFLTFLLATWKFDSRNLTCPLKCVVAGFTVLCGNSFRSYKGHGGGHSRWLACYMCLLGPCLYEWHSRWLACYTCLLGLCMYEWTQTGDEKLKCCAYQSSGKWATFFARRFWSSCTVFLWFLNWHPFPPRWWWCHAAQFFIHALSFVYSSSMWHLAIFPWSIRKTRSSAISLTFPHWWCILLCSFR